MQEQSDSIPLLILENNTMRVTDEAKQFLLGLSTQQKLGVVSVVGKYRTGKSYFINKALLQDTQAFKVGNTVNACTKGIWIHKKMINLENNSSIQSLVLDTEGLGGTQQGVNTNTDSKIFVMSLLLSSYFIFNTVGTIDENSIQELGLIINIAKEIDQQQGENKSFGFPSFMWVIRDFALKLENQHGEKITPKEYLEHALENQKGTSEQTEQKNRIRRMFKHFFPERDCQVFVRPVESEKNLQSLSELKDYQIRQQFLDQIKAIRNKILKKVNPKVIMGKEINGTIFYEMCEYYCSIVNSGSIPNIQTAWAYFVYKEIIKKFEAILLEQSNSSDLISVKKIYTELKNNSLQKFMTECMGENEEKQEFKEKLILNMKEKYQLLKKKLIQEWLETLKEKIETEYQEIEQKMHNDSFKNFNEVKREIKKLRDKLIAKWGSSDYDVSCIHEQFTEINIKAAEHMNYKLQMELKQQNSVHEQQLSIHQKELQFQKEIKQDENNYHQQQYEDIIKEKQSLNLLYIKSQNDLKQAEENLIDYVQKIEQLNNEHSQQQEEIHLKIQEWVKQNTSQKERILQLETIISQQQDKIQILQQFETQIIEKQLIDNTNHKEDPQQTEQIKQLNQQIQTLNQQIQQLNEDFTQLNEMVLQKQNQNDALQQRIIQLNDELQENQMKQENNMYIDIKNDDSNQNDEIEKYNELKHINLENELEIQNLKNDLQRQQQFYEKKILKIQFKNDIDTKSIQGLIASNKQLSLSISQLEEGFKLTQLKIKDLKSFKKIIKSQLAIKCSICQQLIEIDQIQIHFQKCSEQNKIVEKTSNIKNIMNSKPPTYSYQLYNSGQKIKPNNYAEKPSSLSFVETKKTQDLNNSLNNKQVSMESPNGMIEIAVANGYFKKNQENHQYMEFNIFIRRQNQRWSISKTFEDFQKLHDQLKFSFPSHKFPSSSEIFIRPNFNGIPQDQKDLEIIRMEINNYLKMLANDLLIYNSTSFKLFIEMEQYNQNSQQIKEFYNNNQIQSSYSQNYLLQNLTKQNYISSNSTVHSDVGQENDNIKQQVYVSNHEQCKSNHISEFENYEDNNNKPMYSNLQFRDYQQKTSNQQNLQNFTAYSKLQ